MTFFAKVEVSSYFGVYDSSDDKGSVVQFGSKSFSQHTKTLL